MSAEAFPIGRVPLAGFCPHLFVVLISRRFKGGRKKASGVARRLRPKACRTRQAEGAPVVKLAGTAALLALLLASACQTLSSASGPAASDVGQVTDPRELVALTGSPAEAVRLEEVAARQGYAVEGRLSLPGLGLQLVTLRLPEGVAADRAIALLEGRAPGSTDGRNHAYRPPPEPGGQAGPAPMLGRSSAGPRPVAPPGCPSG